MYQQFKSKDLNGTQRERACQVKEEWLNIESRCLSEGFGRAKKLKENHSGTSEWRQKSG